MNQQGRTRMNGRLGERGRTAASQEGRISLISARQGARTAHPPTYLAYPLPSQALRNLPEVSLEGVDLAHVAPDDLLQELKVRGDVGVEAVVGELDVLGLEVELAGEGRRVECKGRVDDGGVEGCSVAVVVVVRRLSLLRWPVDDAVREGVVPGEVEEGTLELLGGLGWPGGEGG